MNKIETLIHFVSNDLEISHKFSSTLKEQLEHVKGVEILNDIRSKPNGSFAAELFTFGTVAMVVLPTLLPAIINNLKEVKLKKKDLSIKIRAKIGDREIEIEYPSNANREEIENITKSFLELLNNPLL